MRRALPLLLALLMPHALPPATAQSAPTTLRGAAPWRASLDHSLRFFTQVARTPTPGAYLSLVDVKGQVTSQEIHVLALSRLAYAFAHGSRWEPARLEEARSIAAFITTQMVREHPTGPYFLPVLELGKEPAIPEVLHVWEQAYGLCGLVETYRHTGDKALLARIRELNRAFLQRFRVAPDRFELAMDVTLASGERSGAGYASVVYPATAYLLELNQVDPEEAAFNEPWLRALCAQAAALWDEESGWVREHGGQNTTAVPGHSFQLAWLCLRASTWTFLAEAERAHYRALGLRILDRTLAQPAGWDSEHAGLYGQVVLSPTPTAKPVKDWWQHAEALPALALAHRMTGDARYLTQFERTGRFYLDAFFDRTGGGEFFSVDATNQPVPDQPKGAKGKSSYHVAECARFVEDYFGPASAP